MNENTQDIKENTADEQNEKVISMWQYFVDCISNKYCNFKGRANRKEFWSFTLFYYLLSVAVFFVLAIIEEISGDNKLLDIMNYLWGLVFLLPAIGVKFRRLHDINYSGWWYGSFYLLIFSLAFVAGIFAAKDYAGGLSIENHGLAKSLMFIIGGIGIICCGVVLCIMPFVAGTKGTNKYGEVPQGKDFKTSTVSVFILVPIIGIFTVGVISGYSKAMIRYKTNKIVDEVVYIAATAKSVYNSSSGYTALYDAETVEYVLNKSYIGKRPTDGSFVNFIGGNILIKPSGKYDKNDNKAFIITFDHLSKDICMNVATLNWAKNSAGFMAMRIFEQNAVKPSISADITDNVTIDSNTDINNHVITADNGKQTPPLSHEEADELCACDKSDTCAITWKFY